MSSDWRPDQTTIDDELAAYRGSWFQQMPQRVGESLTFQLFVFPLFILWKAASLMLVGMALFKLGAFSAHWSRGDYLRLVASGAFVGIPVIAFGVYDNFSRNWDISHSFLLGSQWNYWGSYLVALGWVGLICCGSGLLLLPGLKARTAALGRLAFSNYILQTLICTTIFYGHGLGYFGSVDRKVQALIAFTIYGTQLMIAPLWLKHFSFGPLEWLWRRLTYGKPQPFWR